MGDAQDAQNQDLVFVRLPMTKGNVVSLLLLTLLAILGSIYVFKILSQKSCVCALCSGSYKILEQLGHGGFGRVFKILRKEDGKILVLKKIAVDDLNSANRAQAEAKGLRALQHAIIVQFEDDFLHTELPIERIGLEPQFFVCIVMEFCPGADLKVFIERKRNGDFDNATPSYLEKSQAVLLLSQIASALAYCHQRDIVHRDIKCQNIFLTGGPENCVRLGDFGLSRKWADHCADAAPKKKPAQKMDGISCVSDIDEPRPAGGESPPGSPPRRLPPIPSLTTAGTELYRAPELFQGARKGAEINYKQIDIWCLGLIAVEILSMTFLWERPGLVGARVLQGSEVISEMLDDIPKHFGNDLVDLASSMLQVEPLLRPSADDVVDLLRRMEPSAVHESADESPSVRRRRGVP